MARQLPPVDDDVFEALQQLAEPLVDDINSVLRRLLGANPPAAQTAQVQPGVVGSQADRMDPPVALPASRTASKPRGGRAKAKKATSRPRAARGSLLPEGEYEEPLLRALVAHGGSAPASELIEDVGAALDGRLTAADRELLDSGLTRWKNRVQFVRLKLVQAGQVKKDSPRGVWEITQAGRDRVESVGSSE